MRAAAAALPPLLGTPAPHAPHAPPLYPRRSRSRLDFLRMHTLPSRTPLRTAPRALHGGVCAVLHRTPARIARVAMLALLVPLLGAAAGCAGRNEGAPAELRGAVLPTPLPKPDFALTDTRGATYDFAERTRGQLTFLFFGYTNCPDVCPVQLANLARALKTLSYDQRQRVAVVFVSADPARDTPQRIRAFLDTFDPAFVGLRGPLDSVNAIQAALNLPPAAPERADSAEPSGASYNVGHSAQVLAFTADGLAHVTYGFGTRQADWVRDLPRLLRSPWNRAPNDLPSPEGEL